MSEEMDEKPETTETMTSEETTENTKRRYQTYHIPVTLLPSGPTTIPVHGTLPSRPTERQYITIPVHVVDAPEESPETAETQE